MMYIYSVLKALHILSSQPFALRAFPFQKGETNSRPSSRMLGTRPSLPSFHFWFSILDHTSIFFFFLISADKYLSAYSISHFVLSSAFCGFL